MRRRRKKRLSLLNVVYVILFFTVLLLPLVQMKFKLFNLKGIDEKRNKTPMPTLSSSGTLANYFKDFDSYFKDNFGFREQFIKFNNTLDYKLFNKSNNSNVVIGKNDYLYISEEVDDYNKTNVLSDEQINIIAEKLISFQNDLEERGVKFLFTVAPNKSTIYPEYMPYESSNPDKEGNYDKLMKAINEKKVNNLNLKSLLMDKKKDYDLYYKRDTHWNRISSAFVADSVINYFAPYYGLEAKITPTNIRPGSYPGDLDGLLGIESSIPEYICDIDFQRNDVKLPKMISYYDSFSYEVLPLLNDYSIQRVDLHNLNSPVYFTYPFFENNTKIVFFEIVERYIPKLVEYEFDVFDNDTKSVEKDHKQIDVDMSNKNIHLNEMAHDKNEDGSNYFASTGNDGYMVLDIEKQDLDFLYIELSKISAYTKVQFYWAEEGSDFNDKDTFKMEFNPIKKKYLIDLSDKNLKNINKIRIDIDTEPNKELNIKDIKTYSKMD